MRIDKIPIGENPPWDLNVIIEVPLGGVPVKYELEKESGAMFVDRFLHTSMHYPLNYGFVPHTMSADGDPLDVLIATRIPLMTGCVVRARPIGVLLMEDEAGLDEKIISVPVDKLHPYYRDVSSYRDLPKILLDQISHFFAHYKDLEDGKWVKIKGWSDKSVAEKSIMDAVAAFNKEEGIE